MPDLFAPAETTSPAAKAKLLYMVAVATIVERGTLYGKKPVWRYDAHPGYGQHATNIAAKRAYVTAKNGRADVGSWPDEFVKIHFDVEARNEKTVKILKVRVA